MQYVHRRALEQQQLEEVTFTSAEVRRAMKTFNQATTKCAHGWSPVEPQTLTQSGLDGLTTILNDIVQTATLPTQDRISIQYQIGKPQGGERGIASLGFTYRLVTRLRKHKAA